jgi:hypothetical protein
MSQQAHADASYDRETTRARLVELQNELHDRRARVAELTRQVNLLPQQPKEKAALRIPHSKLRVQIAAICGILSGYGVSQEVGDAHDGRGFGLATTALVFVVVNWFVPWPIRFGKREGEIGSPKKHFEVLALEDERRACEKLEREIAETRRVLGSSGTEESA